MLHGLRTMGATGWLVSQKVLSLLWLAILSPGYCPLSVCVPIACPFRQARHQCVAYANSTVLRL